MPSLESVRHLILGSVYSNSGETTKARMHYVSALKEGELLGDMHTSAFASYELGMLLCKNYEVTFLTYLIKKVYYLIITSLNLSVRMK